MTRDKFLKLIKEDEITSQNTFSQMLDEDLIQSCGAYFDKNGNFLARGDDTTCEKLVLQVLEKMSDEKISNLTGIEITK